MKHQKSRSKLELHLRILSVTPDLEISLHKTICHMNDDLLSELRISHADGVDDTLMVGDLRHPRTGVKALGQSAHQREGI